MQTCLAKRVCILPFETLTAKEDKNRCDCYGNHLGCRADEDLQCGLSGDPVLFIGNVTVRSLKGNRLYWQQEVLSMENIPDLSRKITFFRRPL